MTDPTRDPAQLTELVGAYETGLGTRLSQHERAAIPLAMARQPLWSIAVWVALLDNQDTARRHLAATAPELTWALHFTGLYRFRTRRRCCDLRFGRMGWLRQDRGSWLFVCST
jgi:hypothetical protein